MEVYKIKDTDEKVLMLIKGKEYTRLAEYKGVLSPVTSNELSLVIYLDGHKEAIEMDRLEKVGEIDEEE